MAPRRRGNAPTPLLPDLPLATVAATPCGRTRLRSTWRLRGSHLPEVMRTMSATANRTNYTAKVATPTPVHFTLESQRPNSQPLPAAWNMAELPLHGPSVKISARSRIRWNKFSLSDSLSLRSPTKLANKPAKPSPVLYNNAPVTRHLTRSGKCLPSRASCLEVLRTSKATPGSASSNVAPLPPRLGIGVRFGAHMAFRATGLRTANHDPPTLEASGKMIWAVVTSPTRPRVHPRNVWSTKQSNAAAEENTHGQ